MFLICNCNGRLKEIDDHFRDLFDEKTKEFASRFVRKRKKVHYSFLK